MRLNDFALERYLAVHEFSAPSLLCTSDCESLSVEDLLSLGGGSMEEFGRLNLGYTESPGGEALREEIANLYTTIEPEEIIVFSGAEEAIFVTLTTLLNEESTAVVQTPCYQSLSEIPRSTGCRVIPWVMEEKDNWTHGPAMQSISGHGKTVRIINTPHNPTGHLFTRDQMETMAETANRQESHLFSDEVYRFLEYRSSDHLPGAADLFDKGISVGVMSKAFGLAGLRIGWVATHDAALRRRILAMKDYTTICNSAPSEYLATAALRVKDKLLARNLSIIRENLSLLNKFFARHTETFTWIPPQAGATCFPRLNHGSSEAFCQDLLDKNGVLLLPSTVFGFGDSHFRVGFARKDMPLALAGLENYLNEQEKSETLEPEQSEINQALGPCLNLPR